jgi:hypothetical protein
MHRTLQLCDIHAELVALFQHALATLLNKVVEACRELCHARAEVLEAEVDAGQLVGHRGRFGGAERGAHHAGG